MKTPSVLDYTEDQRWMRAALGLARQAWGQTSPNPMVGAVVVKDGQCIGEGYHHQAGEPHAEVNALADAGEDAQNATIYVTLEPCSSHGRTPPCTKAIIAAGISKVVVGVLDPNPKHAGNGIRVLEAAGVHVEVGVEEAACRTLNEAFFKWIRTGMPFVLLKMAMTLDGKIATRDGDSQWVTGPVARQRVQSLRKWADAILVGGETARTDQPSLNVRIDPEWERQPRRFVVSRNMSAEEAAELLAPGVPPEVIAPDNQDAWIRELKRLGREDVTAVLIEGGGELAASVLDMGIVDKVEFHVAPKILGGRGSRPVVGGEDPLSLADCVDLYNLSHHQLGDDLSIVGYTQPS